ncbi:MAG: NUDIX domain-containing protein [Minisyncoccia bacterium]
MRKGVDNTGISIVYMCHDGNGNFVLSKRSKNCRDEHGAWDQGGGGLEFGDTVENTLKKEITEEYCADILEQEFLGYRDVHRVHNGEKTHWIALDFLVKVDRQKVKNGEPHKFDDVSWFNLNSLPEQLHSQFPFFIKKYKDNLKARGIDIA